MEDYLRIRIAHRDGMGINQLAQTFHHSKRKIREILGEAEPAAYPKRRPGLSILDSFKPIIDAILKADEEAPPKQRHTAAKIFRRLRDEHDYRGGEERVRLYVRSCEDERLGRSNDRSRETGNEHRANGRRACANRYRWSTGTTSPHNGYRDQ